jgi:hypothetical protein
MTLIAGKQLQSPLSVTGSLFGTSSYALTASYAMNGGGGGNIDSSSLVTTSSFNAFTSSVVTTSSFNVFTSSVVTTSSFNNYTSSTVTTSSFNNFTSSVLTTSSFNTFTSSFNNYTSSLVTTSSFNNFTSSVVTTSSFNNFTSSVVSTSSFNNYTSSVVTTSSFNNYTSSIITTGSSGITQTISGSLLINQNLTVLGSSSVQYITSSQLNIGTNLITVNTATPAVRFGGLAVMDSGSTGTGRTGSILWDSQNDVWVYSNPSGSSYDGALLLVGPRNTTGLGNEVGINSWYAAIGNGSHHMTSSAIYNSGSLIRLENNTQVTGSLNVSQGITGSLLGTASNAIYADNGSETLQEIINNSIVSNEIIGTISSNDAFTIKEIDANHGLYIYGVNTPPNKSVWIGAEGSSTTVPESAIGVSLGDYNGISVRGLQSVPSSSFILAYTGDSTQGGISYISASRITFPYTGNAVITGSLLVSGSNGGFGGITASLQGTASFATTASYALVSAGGTGGISQGKVVAIATGYSNLF